MSQSTSGASDLAAAGGCADSPARTLEVLRPIFAAATHDASAAMFRWTDGLMTLTFDGVREIPLENAFLELKLGDQPLTMVVLTLDGELGARMILVFDEYDARQLAASLLGRAAAADGEWTAAEQSALTETGNILGCAYVNALVRLVGVELVPSPPYFIQDYAASVLDQALLTPAMAGDTVLVCQTGFRREGKQLDWQVVFLPTEAMWKAMEGAVASGS
jgi:chemotaxis protein CheC